MANPSPVPPPTHTRWRRGQSGNARGRPALPPELRAIRALSSDEVARLVAKFARMTRAELQAAIQDPETPILELNIAAILAYGAKTGDCSKLGFLLDRTIGRPLAADAPQGDDNDLAALTTDEILERIKEKERRSNPESPRI